jgi:hypothetical protein
MKTIRTQLFKIRCTVIMGAFSACLFLSSCTSYRLETIAGPGTEADTVKVNSYLWGLLSKPQVATTRRCNVDSVGMSEVTFHRSFGNSLIGVVTLGIWSPSVIIYKCSKPCQIKGKL